MITASTGAPLSTGVPLDQLSWRTGEIDSNIYPPSFMKKTGITILLVGLFLMLTAGIDLISKERIISFGSLSIAENRRQSLPWTPLLGLATMAAGACLYLFKFKANNFRFSK
jgi:hypothetical protein